MRHLIQKRSPFWWKKYCMQKMEKKMKSISIKKFILPVLFFLIIFPGCKKAKVTFEWKTLKAKGSYNSVTDESYLSLSGFIKINQSSVNINPLNPEIKSDFLFVELLTWEYTLFAGDEQILLVNNKNVYQIFDKIFVNASDKTDDFIWVYVITETPVKGDIFKGNNPDTVLALFQAIDDNGNLYKIYETVNIQFTRN